MIKIVFTTILIIHGLIHLIGFVKAFGLAKVNQITKDISKLIGLLWFFTALLFIISAIIFLYEEYWWAIAIASIIFSQILIINSWNDAKFGSIINIIILLVAIVGYGQWNFDRKVDNNVESFLKKTNKNEFIVSEKSISHLPNIVQLWLRNSNIIGKKKSSKVHLLQTGKMKTEPDGKWLSFKAEQWFSIDNPGFIWNADVGTGSLTNFSGEDQYINGKGKMLIDLYSIIPIVNASGPKINQGAAVRFLAEIVWFPSASLSNWISWKEITPLKARATLNYKGQKVKGDFTFNKKGQVINFEAKRFYDKTGNKEIWFIDIDKNSYKSFEGKLIPAKSTVTWKLNNGDFTWLKLQILKIDYN